MRRRTVTSAAIAALILVAGLALFIKARGFRASSTPGAFETSAARLVRDFAIPRAAKGEKNPFAGDEQAVGQGRDEFLSRCATCHGSDGRGATPIGSNLYPRVPDLRRPMTQALTDGEIRYIIANGIQLTGMPAMQAIKAATINDLKNALNEAKKIKNTTVIYVETDRENRVGGYAWWEVPVAQISTSKKVQAAYEQLQKNKDTQKYY
jgi:mono/diheme cytochrome c family protein